MPPCLLCNASTCNPHLFPPAHAQAVGCVIKEIEFSSAEVKHKHHNRRDMCSTIIKRVSG